VLCAFSAACQDYDNLEMRFKGCREAVSFPYRKSSFCLLRTVVFIAEQKQAGSHGVALNCAVLEGAPQKETMKIINLDTLSRIK
jgi:hypothetical protein